jgi:uncharacterized protein YebE (UPF0316 family)
MIELFEIIIGDDINMLLTLDIIILCIKVFFCRIIDVSLSTFRTVILVKGKTLLAACIAVIEALIWFLIVREALNHEASTFLDTLNVAIAYAVGFSLGNLIGGELSKRISSTINVQIVTSKKNSDMITALRDAGFVITVIAAEASQYSDEKYIIFAAIENRKLKDFKKIVGEHDANAFVMISDTKVLPHTISK